MPLEAFTTPVPPTVSCASSHQFSPPSTMYLKIKINPALRIKRFATVTPLFVLPETTLVP
jgi:hypothetical protein